VTRAENTRRQWMAGHAKPNSSQHPYEDR
jgi:hypothetical protein